MRGFGTIHRSYQVAFELANLFIIERLALDGRPQWPTSTCPTLKIDTGLQAPVGAVTRERSDDLEADAKVSRHRFNARRDVAGTGRRVVVDAGFTPLHPGLRRWSCGEDEPAVRSTGLRKGHISKVAAANNEPMAPPTARREGEQSRGP